MKQKTINLVLKYLLIIALLAVFMVPFYLMVINSFKTTQQFVDSPFTLPATISFKNYVAAFEKMNFLKAFSNSLVIMVISVTLIIFSSSMAAYFLVRNKWRSTKIIFAILVASMIVPFQAVMIPLVSIYGRLNLMNSKWVLMFMQRGFDYD